MYERASYQSYLRTAAVMGRKRSSSTNNPTPPVRRRKNKVTKSEMEATIAAGPDAAKPGQSFAQKLLIRVVFGVILGFGFLGLLWTDHHLVAGLLVIGQVLAWKELVSLRYNINKEKEIGYQWFRTLNWYIFGVFFHYYYGQRIALELSHLKPPFGVWFGFLYRFHQGINFVLYTVGTEVVAIDCLILSAFVGFISTLKRGTLRYQITQLAWTILTLLLVVGQSHFAILHIYHGFIWLLTPHGLIIINDIMAYVFGVIWGRKVFGDRPLTPLSPNKTWEGFIGGGISTVILGVILAPLFGSIPWLLCPAGTWDPEIGNCPDHIMGIFQWQVAEFTFPASLPIVGDSISISFMPFQMHTVILALFASIIGPFGGFLASGIKRAFNKKDFTDAIPGHGGLMDRVDCQFLMAFFFHVYFLTFISPPGPTLLQTIKNLPVAEQRELFAALQSLLQA